MLSAPGQENVMAYRIAGIDVHKKMLAVVVSDVEVDGEHQFERRMADGDTQEVPVDARSRAPAEPIGVSSGRGPH
jgi:hypothetical protein